MLTAPPPTSLAETIERTIREDWGRVLASLVKTLTDLQFAEDCLQDAIEAALRHWGRNGLPTSPSAWLIRVARRKAIDRIRRDNLFASKRAELSYLLELESAPREIAEADTIPDKRLELIFTCCHPSLSVKTRLALTLRSVGGLTTEEIASAFLDSPAAMAQRLVRARRKIRLARIPYQVPDRESLPERIGDVLGVLYLIFNEGYSASVGAKLMRVDLSQEAVRMTRVMHDLIPDEAEIAGLLALMLLHDSRRRARLDSEGRMRALEHQDRALWNKAGIREGTTLLKRTLACHRIGPYQVQASISALHVEAASWAETDWPQIAALYDLLYRLQPSPVIRINQAMAVSYAASVEAALVILKGVEDDAELASYQSYHVAKADLLTRIGDNVSAVDQLEKAMSVCENETERAFLTEKLERLQSA